MHHGNGGAYMKELIGDLFTAEFDNPFLKMRTDSAILPAEGMHQAFTTDSFVVDPLFFPGGDIGKLAVCGTLNDLAVCGAEPRYLSAGFILEEGLRYETLGKVVRSMAREAKKSGAEIVTGDTKVVNAGKCDKMFISVSGIGSIQEKHLHICDGTRVKPGDLVILNGPPGEHGMAILLARRILEFRARLRSDCRSLHPMVRRMLRSSEEVHFMRDATRGGVATVLCEIAQMTGLGIMIREGAIPVNRDVQAVCDILGFDPLYVANEGKMLAVVAKEDAGKILSAMKKDPAGREAALIGEITKEHPSAVILNTRAGGKRMLDELRGDQLPRIC